MGISHRKQVHRKHNGNLIKIFNALGNEVNQRSQRQQGFVQYVLKMMGIKLQTNLWTNQNPKKPRIV